MLMDGGAMLGYCETGKFSIDNMPANIIRMAMTQAKIGRSIKKRDMTYSAFLAADGAAGLFAAVSTSPDLVGAFSTS